MDERISFKEYLESRLRDSERAVELAWNQLEKRLEAMNAFRNQLKDQAGTFLTKESYDLKHALIQKQVDDLNVARAILDSKASSKSVYISYAISFIIIVIEVIKFIK
jgi:hypothetical protein